MASAFDPAPFIAAEAARRARELATLAPDSGAELAIAAPSRTAENRGSQVRSEASLATIATLAGGADKALPWADDLERMVVRESPADTPPDFWLELVEEAWDVSRRWGQAALDAGWSSLDLFGCNPDPTARRVDRSGLVFLKVTLRTPVRITGLDQQRARMMDANDQPISFYRPVAPGAVHIWDAYPMSTGP